MIDADELDDDFPEDEEGRAVWSTDSLVKAGRLMYRASRLTEQRAEVAAHVADQIQMAKEWGTQRDAVYAEKLDWINNQLKAFALAQREATKDLGRDQIKTLSTVWGDVTTREKKAKWEVTDPELAIKSAQQAGFRHFVHTEVIPEQVIPAQTRESFSLGQAQAEKGLTWSVNGVHDEHGQAIEGITFTPATITATVKPTLERGPK